MALTGISGLSSIKISFSGALMKRRLNMLLPLIFAFILTMMPFSLLEYNQFQRQMIKSEREKSQWAQNASNYLQMFRSLWSYESQLQRRMYVMHRRIGDLKKSMSGAIFLSCLKHFFPARHFPEYTYAGVFDKKNGRIEMFSGEGYARNKLRFFQRLLVGLAQNNELSTGESKSLDSFVRGAFGENLDFQLLAKFRRGKVVRVVFEGSMRLVYWQKIPVNNDASKELIHLNVFDPGSITSLESMMLAAEVIGKKYSQLGAAFVPLEYSDPKLMPVFASSVSENCKKSINRALKDAKKSGVRRDQFFPFGEAFDSGGLRIYRDFIDYSVPYELWVIGKEETRSSYTASFASFIFRLFFFSSWALVMLRVLITGRPIGISLRAWLSLIFIVVGILPLIVFFVAGIFHIDASAYRREQEAIKDAMRQMEEADASGEALLAEYRDFCQRLDQDKEWLELIGSWDENSWRKAWELLPAKTARAGLSIEAMYVFPPDVASLSAKLFFDENSDLSYEREERVLNFYKEWIRKAYFEIVPEIMIGENPDLIIFKGRSGTEMMRYFLSNRGDIEFLDLEAEKQFLYQNFVLKNGKPYNWYFFRVDILKKFEKYLQASIANLQAVFTDNIYSIAILEDGVPKIIFPEHPSNRISLLKRIAGNWIELAAVSRTRIIEQLEDYLVITYPCVKSGPFVLSGVVFLNGFRLDAARQEFLLSIIVVLMSIPVFLVARFAAGYLVSPLIGVEKGLKRVADEDYSQKMLLKRRDELGMLTSAFDRMTEGLKERRNLGRFVSASLDEQIGNDEKVAKDGMQKRFGAILCCDIRKFTTLSEQYPVREIVEMLNEHLAAMAECVRKNDGLVEQFIGDAILAVFYGENENDCAKSAVNSATDMILAHAEAIRKRSEIGLFGYEIGVGIDVGYLLSGIINAGSRREFSVVGAIRSRAEKLEANTKLCRRHRIVVSDNVVTLLGRENFINLDNESGFELARLERFK